VRITLDDPGPDGLRTLTWGTEGQPGWFAWDATQHDLNDLEAVLAQDKAMARTCPAEAAGHTCGLPRHDSPGHQCRACPHTWRGAP
jgi:hypothetical protein